MHPWVTRPLQAGAQCPRDQPVAPQPVGLMWTILFAAAGWVFVASRHCLSDAFVAAPLEAHRADVADVNDRLADR